MPVKQFNPTSPGSRFKTVNSFEEITTSTPERNFAASTAR